MREILFRGKRVDNGEWAVGNLMASDDALEGYEAIIIPRVNSDIYTSEVKSDLGICKWYIVDQKTVCQYTGLTDKNGQKIWENDIVEDASFDWKEIEAEPYVSGVVKFKKGTYDSGIYEYNGWVVEEKNGNVDHTPLLQYEEDENRRCGYRVLGNIFDNPELLTED